MNNGVFDSNVGGTPAVSATGTDGADGIDAGSDTGVCVSAVSGSGAGVFAQSQSGIGLHAVGGGVSATTPLNPRSAIFAEGGVFATAADIAVVARSKGLGIEAEGTTGVTASGTFGPGVNATSISGIAVEGSSQSGPGVQGSSLTSTGISGITESGVGVSANGGSTGVALQVTGKVEVQGNSVGSVTMAAHTKTLTVSNPAATANSLILLTPLDNPQELLWVGARSAGSFTIDVSHALPANVTIMFLIVN